MFFIGIDPGISGAIAVIDDSDKVDFDFQFFDTPTVTVKSGKKFKNVMDIAACVLILETFQANSFLVIEKVQAMPGKPSAAFAAEGYTSQAMGATSAFNFGMGFGIWQGIVGALRIPHSLVHPATWKAALMPGMTKEKDASRVRATQLYPWTAKDLSRKKDHGRADALLLAEYGRRTYTANREWN